MNRRDFLKASGVVTLSQFPIRKIAASEPTNKKVAIFGGGVAGLTAAHELLDRGFQVTLYEMRDDLGGKARTIYVPDSGANPLPGEHGFRLFFALYSHVFDIMRRIPYENNKNGVLDNLIPLERLCFASESGRRFEIPLHMKTSFSGFSGFKSFMYDLFSYSNVGLRRSDVAILLDRILFVLSSCEDRRYAELEMVSWSDFLGTKGSPALNDIFGTGVTTMVQAVRGNHVSARTMGQMFYHVFSQVYKHMSGAIFCLNGPTSEKWIIPWQNFLIEKKGLSVRRPAKVVDLTFKNQKIVSAVVEQEGQRINVDADYFVSAVPLEALSGVVLKDNLAMQDPAFLGLENLKSDWLVGAQFFFDQDIRLPSTILGFTKSPWSLAAISQNSFWKKNVDKYGGGSAKGILSVDIGNWHSPGLIFNKPASQCTREEVRQEIWAQLFKYLDEDTKNKFKNARLVNWMVDPSMEFKIGGNDYHDPLFINTVNSWKDRPTTKTRFENFFVAGDFTKTLTDLSCMEGACESGKRAANAVLSSEGMSANIGIFRQPEPLALALDKVQDAWRFHHGLPNKYFPK